ncbi:MBL fold metallo-hydrolase [Pseudoalteromonas sp. MMG024]|uniref:MBL fold metallo-hydrolase n=1 Tax=Pseudoalteromonas sp. MMG024 TaxID=2909980 RepID=UPI001F43F11C|nr:MBL fold metallo-hydrolase [Pseudoalteromonas sp. MMG024]MCF6458973.1 FprA family A-type flavoprotein [Pseudoalteromonas sp. MMG024]
MKSTDLYQGKHHKWIVFGRDQGKSEKIIDTNQYMIVTNQQTMLLDPGGIELFSAMLAGILSHTELEKVTTLFASHQDPDIISSLGLWDKTIPNAKLYAPWLWEGFIRHFGMDNIEYKSIPDEGQELRLDGVTFRFIPAHFLHSSGNFHVYDAEAKILMSGDIGAALEESDAPMFVEDFAKHADKMRYFHQRWMPSNSAKKNWIARVRELDIDMMAPQHGRIFKGEAVQEFLEWFDNLEVGIVNS